MNLQSGICAMSSADTVGSGIRSVPAIRSRNAIARRTCRVGKGIAILATDRWPKRLRNTAEFRSPY